jgi:hypothetical protein
LVLGTGGSAPGSSNGPFSSSGCEPQPQRCGPNSRPVRVSRLVVRPGRKNGGTTLVFKLTRRTLVRFTIVRVYPSCKRIGSFSVHARAGANRVRFNGRFRGRALPAGTYRLLVHARGQATPTAAVTIVVMRGRASQAVLRRARNANSCSLEAAREIEAAAGAGASGGESSGTPSGAERRNRASVIPLAIVGAVKGVTNKTRALTANINDDFFANPLILTIVGLLTLCSACLGAFALARLSRMTRSRLLS